MAKTGKADKLNYEQALQELEDILEALESEQHGLDETMAMFERGKELIRHCQQLLNQAELKVSMLEEKNESEDAEEQN